MKNPFGITERKCKKSDYGFVYALYRKTVFPYMTMTTKINKSIFDKDFYGNYENITLLMYGKRRIGFYDIKFHDNYLQIKRLYLLPNYQKKGIGTFIMRHFETLGKAVLRLEVWITNPAKVFYHRLGYKTIGKNGNFYELEKTVRTI